MTIIYQFFMLCLVLLSGCQSEGDQRSIEGIYVIRYSKSEIDEYFNNDNKIPIDLEKIEFFVPKFEGESMEKLVSLVVKEGLLVRENNLFQLPSSDINNQISYFSDTLIKCTTELKIPDILNERNLYSSNKESKYLYALYSLKGHRYQFLLKNSTKTNLVLNSILKVSTDHEYINCSFICDVESIIPYDPVASQLEIYR